MKKLVLLVLTAFMGCHVTKEVEPQFVSSEKQRKESILDGLLNQESTLHAIGMAERNLPDDVWVDSPYRFNESRDRRARELASKLVQDLPGVLMTLSAPALVDSFKVVDRLDEFYSGVVGYTYEYGNLMILKELQSRSREELEVLRTMTFRDVELYEGRSGPADTLEQVVKFRILDSPKP